MMKTLNPSQFTLDQLRNYPLETDAEVVARRDDPALARHLVIKWENQAVFIEYSSLRIIDHFQLSHLMGMVQSNEFIYALDRGMYSLAWYMLLWCVSTYQRQKMIERTAERHFYFYLRAMLLGNSMTSECVRVWCRKPVAVRRRILLTDDYVRALLPADRIRLECPWILRGKRKPSSPTPSDVDPFPPHLPP